MTDRTPNEHYQPYADFKLEEALPPEAPYGEMALHFTRAGGHTTTNAISIEDALRLRDALDERLGTGTPPIGKTELEQLVEAMAQALHNETSLTKWEDAPNWLKSECRMNMFPAAQAAHKLLTRDTGPTTAAVRAALNVSDFLTERKTMTTLDPERIIGANYATLTTNDLETLIAEVSK